MSQSQCEKPVLLIIRLGKSSASGSTVSLQSRQQDVAFVPRIEHMHELSSPTLCGHLKHCHVCPAMHVPSRTSNSLSCQLFTANDITSFRSAFRFTLDMKHWVVTGGHSLAMRAFDDGTIPHPHESLPKRWSHSRFHSSPHSWRVYLFM
jgi:hypothetical protein